VTSDLCSEATVSCCNLKNITSRFQSPASEIYIQD
jgi:hypothetical protein